MKIATWNVNSIGARLPLVQDWLLRAQPDVLCMQELKCMDEKFPLAEFNAIGYDAAVFGQKSYNGVAILAKQPLKDIQKGFPGAEPGAQSRLIAATVGGVQIVNVYIPNGQEVGAEKYVYKLGWLKHLREYFDQGFSPSGDVLLCGDFNVAMDERDVYDPKAWEGKIHFSLPERAAMEHIKDWGFTDVFRKFTSAGGHYSWWDYRMNSFPRKMGLRIDYIWVSEPLAQRSVSAVIDAGPRGLERPSDHAPVIAEFE